MDVDGARRRSRRRRRPRALEPAERRRTRAEPTALVRVGPLDPHRRRECCRQADGGRGPRAQGHTCVHDPRADRRRRDLFAVREQGRAGAAPRRTEARLARGSRGHCVVRRRGARGAKPLALKPLLTPKSARLATSKGCRTPATAPRRTRSLAVGAREARRLASAASSRPASPDTAHSRRPDAPGRGSREAADARRQIKAAGGGGPLGVVPLAEPPLLAPDEVAYPRHRHRHDSRHRLLSERCGRWPRSSCATASLTLLSLEDRAWRPTTSRTAPGPRQDRGPLTPAPSAGTCPAPCAPTQERARRGGRPRAQGAAHAGHVSRARQRPPGARILDRRARVREPGALPREERRLRVARCARTRRPIPSTVETEPRSRTGRRGPPTSSSRSWRASRAPSPRSVLEACRSDRRGSTSATARRRRDARRPQAERAKYGGGDQGQRRIKIARRARLRRPRARAHDDGVSRCWGVLRGLTAAGSRRSASTSNSPPHVGQVPTEYVP